MKYIVLVDELLGHFMLICHHHLIYVDWLHLGWILIVVGLAILLWGSTILPYLFPCHLSWTKVFVLIGGIILLLVLVDCILDATFLDVMWMLFGFIFLDLSCISGSNLVLVVSMVKKGEIFDYLT